MPDDRFLGRRLISAARQARWEAEIETAVKRALDQHRTKAMGTARTIAASSPPDPFEIDTWDSTVDAEVAPVVRSVFREAANAPLAFLKLPADIRARLLAELDVDEEAATFVGRIRGIGPTVADALRLALNTGLRNGESIKGLQDRITGAFQVGVNRSEMIARTEVHGAAMRAGHASVGALAGTGTNMVKTWLCVDGETEVFGHNVSHVARRWYEGPMVQLRTVAGRVLTITPEHEICTQRGWVRAESIHPGDELVSYPVGIERPCPLAGVMPDVGDVPSKIGQVFDAADKMAPSLGLMRRVVNFYGEGGYCQINVVPVGGVLKDWVQPSVPEGFSQFLLEAPDVLLPLMLTVCSSDQGSLIHPPTRIRPSARSDTDRNRFRRLSAGTKSSRLRLGTDRHASQPEALLDSSLAASVLTAQSSEGDPGLVGLAYDRCDDVQILATRGHVFDFTTSSHWMIANGLVVHNSTLDDRTRDDHADADGQEVPFDQPFVVGGEELMYPGDPAGSAENVISCRCDVLYDEAPLDGEVVAGEFGPDQTEADQTEEA